MHRNSIPLIPQRRFGRVDEYAILRKVDGHWRQVCTLWDLSRGAAIATYLDGLDGASPPVGALMAVPICDVPLVTTSNAKDGAASDCASDFADTQPGLDADAAPVANAGHTAQPVDDVQIPAPTAWQRDSALADMATSVRRSATYSDGASFRVIDRRGNPVDTAQLDAARAATRAALSAIPSTPAAPTWQSALDVLHQDKAMLLQRGKSGDGPLYDDRDEQHDRVVMLGTAASAATTADPANAVSHGQMPDPGDWLCLPDVDSVRRAVDRAVLGGWLRWMLPIIIIGTGLWAAGVFE